MILKEIKRCLSTKSKEEKIRFNELFLFNITVMNRAIWDTDEMTDKAKVECLRWSNELVHRVWNILFDLKCVEDTESENRLVDNIDFYRKQSKELEGHLGATLSRTLEKFKVKRA